MNFNTRTCSNVQFQYAAKKLCASVLFSSREVMLAYYWERSEIMSQAFANHTTRKVLPSCTEMAMVLTLKMVGIRILASIVIYSS